MSRSNPGLQNPALRYFKWRGSDGTLVHYDKEAGQEVVVKLPFEFLVLDQLATITGYCEQDGSGYWSNEVRSVAKEELTVRTSKGTKQAGLYKDLADVRSKGAKYAKSIYIAFDLDGEMVIGNLKASGAALTAWIELSNKCVPTNGKILLTGREEGKKGATTYYTPTFEWKSSDKTEDDKAIALDKELQVYLSQYLSTALFNRENSEEEPVHSDEEAAMAMATSLDNGEEINLDDIPF